MPRTRKTTRLSMEALETRRVLSIEPIGYVFTLQDGSEYTREICQTCTLTAALSDGLYTQFDLGGTSSIRVEALDLPIELAASGDETLLSETPALEFHGSGNQLNELPPDQISIVEVLTSAGAEPKLNVPDVTLAQPTNAKLYASTTDIQPILNELSAARFVDQLQGVDIDNLRMAFDSRHVVVGGNETNYAMISTPDPGTDPGLQLDFSGTDNNEIGLGSESGGGSLFDVPPTRLGLDVTDLPDPLDNAAPPTGDEIDPDFNSLVPGEELGGSSLGDLGDDVEPEAPEFVAIDIGTNHLDDEPLDPSSIDIAMSAPANADMAVIVSNGGQVATSEIEMARLHRLQLAAASRLPVPMGSVTARAAANPVPEMPGELGPDDFVLAIGREASGDWLRSWAGETSELADRQRARLQVADDRADASEAAVPKARRAEMLIDAQSSIDRQKETEWHWTVEAFLASFGIGAMAFYDRYGRADDERRRFQLRS